MVTVITYSFVLLHVLSDSVAEDISCRVCHCVCMAWLAYHVCTHLGTASPIHLGRDPAMNECAGVQLTCRQCDPFPTRMFMAREDTTFIVEIGPSANPRGYTGITGMYTIYRNILNIKVLEYIQYMCYMHIGQILIAYFNDCESNDCGRWPRTV